MKFLGMLKRYSGLFSNIRLWEWILLISIELILRIAIVFLWNYLFSQKLNIFLFDQPQLSYFKGIILVSLILFLAQSKSDQGFSTINYSSINQ